MTSTRRLPRLMFAAPKSGSGKTIITCGFLSYLKNSGRSVTAYKCGPDYIDPMFHRDVIGVSGGNLDTYFAGEERINNILYNDQSGVAVFEGVMGLYDGLGGVDLKASSYDLARATGTPIILVIDAHGMGRTVLSLVKGILEDDSCGLIKGLILNRTTEHFYMQLYPMLEKVLNNYGVKPLGYVPRLKDISLESRHLGLKLPKEVENLKLQVLKMEETLKSTCDIKGLEEIMDRAIDISGAESGNSSEADEELTLAVARDQAFCFYYRENMEAFTSKGVRLVEFSPIKDKALPEGIDGLLLGGGYPELFLKELSANASMLTSIRKAVESGLPSLAECGGFMYLHSRVADENGDFYGLTGIIDGECEKRQALVRFGYMEVEAEDRTWIHGIKGHEFHYYDSTDNGSSAVARKPVGGRSWPCLKVEDNHVWGFPHFYYPSHMEFVDHFVAEMRKYHAQKLCESRFE